MTGFLFGPAGEANRFAYRRRLVAIVRLADVIKPTCDRANGLLKHSSGQQCSGPMSSRIGDDNGSSHTGSSSTCGRLCRETELGLRQHFTDEITSCGFD